MTDIQLEQVLPGDIERRSFEIIQEELSLRGIYLEPENEMVIKRAIHTTADFDYAQNLVFSGQAVKRGTEALKAGAVIVTDTNMGLSGINKKRLSALGGEAFCFMADEDVALQAKEQGTTRAVASMEKAARLYGLQGRPLIFAATSLILLSTSSSVNKTRILSAITLSSVSPILFSLQSGLPLPAAPGPYPVLSCNTR